MNSVLRIEPGSKGYRLGIVSGDMLHFNTTTLEVTELQERGSNPLSEPRVAEPLQGSKIRPDELFKAQMQSYYEDIARLNGRRSEFISVPCPACGSLDSAFAFEKYSFSYVICHECSTLYMNPRPSPEVIADFCANSSNFRFWKNHIYPSSESVRRAKLHKPWLKRIVKYCDSYSVPKGLLVEIGAGFGTFASVARESAVFDRVIAVEPNPELAQACRDRGVPVIKKRVEAMSGEPLSADVAVAFEVVEHLFSPRDFFTPVREVVKKGGLLVVSCPNAHGFDIALLGSSSWAVDPWHINLFNPGSLTRLAESCGFQVLEVSTPGRLDAELVKKAIQDGRFDVSGDPFLKRVLVDEWDRLGGPFQQFLAAHGLSSHMWLVAQRQD